jgi:hypothetical protein
MRYRHDPKFRGRLRSMGRGGAAIIVAIITQYLLGKWLADIESKQIQKDIEKLAPKVEAQLAESLASKADRFDDLLEADPDTEIHMNIVYRLGYWRDLDLEAGMTEAYGSAEFVKAEFSEKAAENGIRFDEIQYFSCGFASMRWDTFTVSEPIKVKDLAE